MLARWHGNGTMREERPWLSINNTESNTASSQTYCSEIISENNDF